MARIPINTSRSKHEKATAERHAEEEKPEMASAADVAAEESLDAAETDQSAEPAELRRQLKEKDAEIHRLEQLSLESNEQILRARADIENVRRRSRQEREEAAQFGTQELLRELLPIMDNFERALSVENTTVDSLREGIELTLRQLRSLLPKHGVEPIPGVGETFDAKLHDAIMRGEPTEEFPAGSIMDELQKGYTLNGRLLRPSLVKVAQEG